MDESSAAVQKGKAVSSLQKNLCFRKQRGIALLLSFVVLILAAGYVLTSYLSPTSVKLARDKEYADILQLARETVVAFAVSTSGAGERPGNLPAPDVVADSAATKNYNGDSELGCFDQSKPGGLPLIIDHINVRCLGRLPWRTFKLSGQAFSENDATGTMPWYALSANLAFQKCLEYLNSDILAFSYTGFICPVDDMRPPTSLPYPWLTVRDARGAVLSNRVAVVIIVPGPALNGQTRPPSPNLAGPNQYLDTVTVTVTTVTADCPGPPCTFTFSNADLDNDFIQADPGPTFNDRLIYITIDELMAKIEDRAGQEIRAAVQRFHDQYGSYPWLAPHGDPSVSANYAAAIGARVGLIPFHEIGEEFTTDFSWRITGGTLDTSGTVDANALRNNTLNLVVSNGKCVWTNMKAVNCTGEILNPEPVTKPTVAKREVQIEYPTSWTNPVATPFPATATTFTTRQVARPAGSFAACLTTSLIRCVIVHDYNAAGVLIGDGSLRAGSGSLTTSGIRLYPEFPEWVTDNHWHEFALGAIGPGWVAGGGAACPCLSTNLDGNPERSDVKFLVMMAGGLLAGQIRPSASANDYFDSANNRAIATGLIFDRQSAASVSFNDRLYY